MGAADTALEEGHMALTRSEREELAREAHELLSGTAVATILKPQHIQTIPNTESVGGALEKLAHHKLLSAPLVNDKGKPTGGFVDVRRFLGSFLACARDAGVMSKATPMLARMREFEELGAGWSKGALADALKAVPAHGGPTDDDGAFLYKAQVNVTTTLAQLISDGFLVQPSDQRPAAHEPNGEHRLGVFDEKGDVINVISQSDIASFLLRNLEKIPTLDKSTVRQLRLGVPESPADQVVPGIISVRPERPTIEALELCFEAGLSAVGVVSPDSGELIANLSISDFRGIEPSHLGILALPSAEFLAVLHKTSYMDYAERTSHAKAHRFFQEPGSLVGQRLVTCATGDTYGQVLEKIVRNRVHRVFVTDPKNRPMGVITLTDLISCVSG